MQYGKAATELLRELQRDKKQIPPYNVQHTHTRAHHWQILQTFFSSSSAAPCRVLMLCLTYAQDAAMRRIIQESNDLLDISRAQMTSYVRGGKVPADILPALFIEQGAVNWNKRCALAYLDERLTRTQQLWWQTNGLLSTQTNSNTSTDQPATTTATTTAAAVSNTHLAPHELQFFNDYNRLLLSYIQQTDIPLTQDQLPPRAVWLTVEVLRDGGRIEGADGTPFELKAGNRKRMRRIDAENLVRQGIVRVVNDNVV